MTPSGVAGTWLQVEAGRVGSGSRNDGGRTEPRREYSQGLTGKLATLRATKGGQLDGRRGDRNGHVEQGLHGPRGTWGTCQGRKYRECRMGSGGRQKWTLVLPSAPITFLSLFST